MKNINSIWSDTASLPGFESLDKDISTDVLVIGGGMAGVLCAHMLARAGVKYMLVEAGTVCGGITKNTTAKITFQHGLIYDKLMRGFGAEKARLYLSANKAALEKYRELCADIDCGFEEKDAYVYSLNNRRKIEKEIAALERLGCKADFEQTPALPFRVAGSVKLKNQAQFNLLQFVSAIAAGLNIYENTEVLEVGDHVAVTRRGKITAKKIIAATHFPFINKHGGYFIKMYQHRSYVLALENAADVGGMYVDEAEKGMSFRSCGNMLLIGGGDHRTGKRGGSWRELEEFAGQYYPKAREAYRWAAQDCMTLDGVPYIGRYSRNTPDFYVATGFNKWGMTSSMAAASLLADMVTGKENPYAEVFSPSRSILHPQLAVNAAAATANMLTISKKRCPHLGCALKWNAHERTWDCPCHGSRFTEGGKLIDNPATGDLKCCNEKQAGRER